MTRVGIRVRKLARELRQSPRDVLQLLKSLGFERYQSPEDMISDTVAARVRSSAPSSTNGRRAPDPARSRARAAPAPAAPAGDLMAQLVPGVKRTRGDQRSGSLRSAEESALQRQRAEAARIDAELKAQREGLARAEKDLQAREAQLSAETARLDAHAGSLGEREAALQSEIEAFEAARATFIAEQQLRTEVAATRPNVVELLRERGLRGLDEAERALGALAQAHLLGPFIKDLATTDEEGVRQLLAERLVLVGGEVPEGLSLPAVSVSTDRGDLPGARVLERAGSKLAEQWLLHGFRAVTIAGLPPKWHPLVRSLVDRRVTVSFVPPTPNLPSDLGPSEAWFVWGPPRTESVQPRVFFVPADGDLVLWLQRATGVLAARE